jgi:hypothetical protein
VPVEEAGQDEQHRAENRSRHEPQQRAAALGIPARDGGGEDEMKETDEEVRAAEQHGVVSEGARHRQGHPEHRAHRGEHRQPDAAFVHVERARQPRVDAPRPPQCGQDEHSTHDPTPRRVVREQARDLCDREHEDQVEEELERRDLVLGVRLVLVNRLALRVRLGHDRTLARPCPQDDEGPATPALRVTCVSRG